MGMGHNAAAAAGVHPDHWQMIVARVPLGSQTTGHSGISQAPEGFDSVNSGNRAAGGGVGLVGVPAGAAAGIGNLYCHVVFDNDQAHPEYVVTFKKPCGR